jgi:hypothetical protein
VCVCACVNIVKELRICIERETYHFFLVERAGDAGKSGVCVCVHARARARVQVWCVRVLKADHQGHRRTEYGLRTVCFSGDF